MRILIWVLGLAGGLAALTLAMNLPRERRLRRLAAARRGVDAFAAFRAALPEIPEEMAREVYRGVQGLVAGEDFPLRADDDLWRLLEVDQGALQDLMEELCRSGSTDSARRDEAHPAVTTVGDLVRAVWARRRGERA